MLKTLTLVAAGLAAGFVVAFWLLPDAPTAASGIGIGGAAPVAPADGAAESTARLASLELAFAAETERRVELEQRIADLGAALDELRAARPNGRVGADNPRAGGPPAGGEVVGPRGGFPRDPISMAENRQRALIDRLVEAGFAPDRAEWIERRAQELRVQQMQAQYEATRQGKPLDPAAQLSVERTLRNELGDADYERVLEAQNRPTSVDVLQVLASSPAESAGLKPGDQIVTYAGTRVFDTAELNTLTFQGNPGESVVVEIRRNGQPVQLVMPRGPLGITGGLRGPAMIGPGPVGR